MFSHSKLPPLPNCKVIRFNYEYTIVYAEEEFPKNFTVEGLELFSSYLLVEILELVDLNWKAHDDPDGCPRFHFMPRFTRELRGNLFSFFMHFLSLSICLYANPQMYSDVNNIILKNLVAATFFLLFFSESFLFSFIIIRFLI